jgi:hypothetical protein
MQFEGVGFGPEYIFYKLYKQIDMGKYVPILESETSRKLPDGKTYPFKVFEVHSAPLVQDDESRKVMIEVFNWYFRAC